MSMSVNTLGLISALTAFLSIWWGHVGVRKIEAISVKLWPPMIASIFLGLACEVAAVRTESLHMSAVYGIAGVVFLWDAFEFYRQEKRIKKGHAPANPDNPRHARILADYPAASVIDWLDRDPRGQSYSAKELDEIEKGGE